MSNKTILLLLNLIIVILIGVSAIKGIRITDDIKINSVKETLKLDDEYQVVLNNYTKAQSQYNEILREQEKAITNFEQSKQQFEQIKNVNSYETLSELAIDREYNIEALWIRLGLIAESNELTHVFNIEKSQETEKYNINVNLSGTYSGIRNFIDDIMMDMDLMFKAENIVISGGSAGVKAEVSNEKTTSKANNNSAGTSSSGGTLTATFVIKDINIKM